MIVARAEFGELEAQSYRTVSDKVTSLEFILPTGEAIEGFSVDK
jgi:hypothetical protein